MQITELIENTVQCLEALGLDPETIYDYRCSAFKPVAERKGKREQMSVDNVEKFISKYATKAHAIFPESPEHIYPHMWRHSRAMHLYRNGMPLELVAEWLGHSRTETTRRFYANADGTMKKEAIEKATSQINPLRSNDLELDWKSDEELLRKLYCLG